MLFKNTAAQSTTLLTGYLLSFILAPVMLGRLGLAQFGVWAVTGAVATYAGLFDLGITRVLSRFVALYDSHDDERGVRECFTIGLVGVTVVGVALFAGAAASASLFVELFGVLSEQDMRLVLLSAAGIFTAQAYRKVFSAIPIGMRRMVPPNVAGTTNNVLNFAFSIGALVASGDLVVYALANAIAEVLGLLPTFVSMVYVWRRPRLAVPSAARTREIVVFGLKSQTHFLSDLVNLQTDKIVIALLVGVRAAATYEIAARVMTAVKAIGVLTVSALIPTATAYIVERGRGAVSWLYRHYTRRAVSVAFPVFVVTCVTAPFLLVAWLGEVPGDGALIMVILTLAYFVNTTIEVAMNVATGDGRPGMVAFNSARAAVMNIIFSLALAPLFGLWGVLLGTFLAVTIGSLLFVRDFHRTYDLPLGDYVRAVGPPAALALGLAAPFALAHLLVDGAPDSRLAATGYLAVIGGGYGLAYWLAASRLGFLPDRLSLRRLRRGRAEVAPVR